MSDIRYILTPEELIESYDMLSGCKPFNDPYEYIQALNKFLEDHRQETCYIGDSIIDEPCEGTYSHVLSCGHINISDEVPKFCMACGAKVVEYDGD